MTDTPACDKTPATDKFWNEYRAATGVTAARYEVVFFGDSRALADELLALVLAGRKRATASLLREYETTGEPVPAVGDYVMVLDGGGVPRCIWRTTDIEIKPLIAVDDRFAWDEGEADRTRAGWLADHRTYFARQAERDGFAMSDDIETVFERFTIVWPPAAADKG